MYNKRPEENMSDMYAGRSKSKKGLITILLIFHFLSFTSLAILLLQRQLQRLQENTGTITCVVCI